MNSLFGKKVFITGGAQGIGKEMAIAFADECAELILTDVNKKALDKTVAELKGKGTKCSSYVLDVTDLEAISKVRDEVKKECGSIDVLVNNAGIVFGGPFLEMPIEKHIATYRVNVEGVVGVTHAFLPLLIESSDAHLLNIASASGLIGLPNGSTYASSKWAVIGFSESIRVELKKLGLKHVGVTTVCPSYISTGMFDGVQPPLLTKMLDPQKLARKILKAVKDNETFVLEPWLVKVTPLIKGLLPTKVSDMISDLFGANSSMEQWHGHDKH